MQLRSFSRKRRKGWSGSADKEVVVSSSRPSPLLSHAVSIDIDLSTLSSDCSGASQLLCCGSRVLSSQYHSPKDKVSLVFDCRTRHLSHLSHCTQLISPSSTSASSSATTDSPRRSGDTAPIVASALARVEHSPKAVLLPVEIVHPCIDRGNASVSAPGLWGATRA